jgi:exodeoxyribonuclease VII small subunit
MPNGTGEDATKAAAKTAAGDDAGPPERFEELLGRLRVIVERLEGGNLPLEESLRAFEEGMALCKRGALILDGAEKKVEMLLGTGGGGGTPATARFEMPEE